MKTIELESIEHYTQAIGRELYERSTQGADDLFKSETWTSRLLNWSTRHEDARLQLFRFVDVLPTLRSDKEVLSHLREYFRGRPDPFSGLLKVGLGLATTGPLAQKAVAATLRKGLQQVARTFIAATTPQEAVKRAEEFRRERTAFTLDVLGEATLSHQEAEAYQAKYLELLNTLTDRSQHWERIPQIDQRPDGLLPPVNLSVKVTALHPHFDPIDPKRSIREAVHRLYPIAEMAVQKGAHVHIDVEDYAIKELTFDTFKALCTESAFKDYRHLGIVLQAYLRESYEDAERLVAWARERGTPITVRLVKGAYWDYETVHARLEGWPIPVYLDKRATDANFERITELFLRNHDIIDLAIGSHNIRSVAHALAVARHLQLPPRALEFQFLYGMAGSMRAALTDMGERTRVYTTFGELIPGMAYLVRRLLENTSNESFLRKGFVEEAPVQDLLASPHVTHTGTSDDEHSTNGHQRGNGGENGDGNGVGNGNAGKPQPRLGQERFRNQPLLDFSQEEHRAKMRSAIERVRAQLGDEYPLVIGDDRVQSAEWQPSRNPANPQEIIGRVAYAGPAHAEEAVRVAQTAYKEWRARPVEERCEILYKAADLMDERRCQLAAWMILEAGKPWREADGDVAEAIDFLRYYAMHAAEIARPVRMGRLVGEVNDYMRTPLGVTAVIAPWNFPLAILTGMSSAALATGNTVILKPAEPTPVIAYQLFSILREAGVPAGVVNYLPGAGASVGRTLVDHPDVRAIAFTGSRKVGLSILQSAAVVPPGSRHVKRVVAEMGGKNAIIVDADADLDEAVQGVLLSAFGFAGQKCSACSRAIVLRDVYDAFVARLVEAARSIPFDTPEEPHTLIGPVISDEAARRIREFIERGHHEGVPLLVQQLPSRLAESGGFFVPPTIFGDVPNEATIACEEIFGPVLSCMRAESFQHALDLAMDSDFALTGGLFSRNPAHVRVARDRFEVGNLYINRKTTGALVGRQPFGGLRLSGVGFKAGGPDYLLQFMESRTITENTLRRGFASEDVGVHNKPNS